MSDGEVRYRYGRIPAGDVFEAQCPVVPEHGRSMRFGDCPDCGMLVVGCLEGCSEADLLAALFPGEDVELTGHEVIAEVRGGAEGPDGAAV